MSIILTVLVATASAFTTSAGMWSRMPSAISDGADGKLLAVKPVQDVLLRWFHVERTGTSFANVLFTWACEDISDDFFAESSSLHGSDMATLKNMSKYKLVMCPGFLHAHYAIGAHACQTYAGVKTFAGMFREPGQRLISYYHHEQAQCAAGLHCNEYFQTSKTAIETAKQYQGCYAKMLNGLSCGAEDTSDMQLSMYADNAIVTLHTQFAFVGIVEDWDISVCLFHVMLGGSCNEREFVNVDRIGNDTIKTYDQEAVLGSWFDKYDHLVYEAARTTYYKNIIRHTVSKKLCRETACKDARGHFTVIEGAPLR
eukprot:NODE_10359_length_1358_cov_2.223396.p1 GENE.NODE_10359_length_1358_cov_2.223396~~NODE_10359_length_1358_cov_2.223396.p1  ORF type:complete len:313 (+),score=76.04 NODE_10359_length_1358_cov_2.223396:107-1045(+)